jgi:hypothetical protein
MEMVEKNLDNPWDWYGLSQNPNVTLEMVDKYPTKPWNWEELSHNVFDIKN